jgi:magnesium-transporting ATPase (P-type)
MANPPPRGAARPEVFPASAMPWHALAAEEVAALLGTDPESGLARVAADHRRALVGALAYFWAVGRDGAGPRANTIAFLALVLIHPFQAMNCRSDRVGWWRLPSNTLTWVALLTLTLAQWAATSWAPLARLLGVVPLSGLDWIVSAVAVLWPVAVLEAVKARRSRTHE